VARPTLPAHQGNDGGLDKALSAERQVFWGEAREFVETPIYDRDRLMAGSVIGGPAIVEQMDSTTVIPPEYRATVDTIGNMLIQKK